MSGRFGFRRTDMEMYMADPHFYSAHASWQPYQDPLETPIQQCFRCSGYGHLAKDCGTPRPKGRSPSAHRRDEARLEAFLVRRQFPFASLDNKALASEIQTKEPEAKRKEHLHSCVKVVHQLASDMKTIKQAMSHLVQMCTSSFPGDCSMAHCVPALAKAPEMKALTVDGSTPPSMAKHGLLQTDGKSHEPSVPRETQTDLVPVTDTSSQISPPSEAYSDLIPKNSCKINEVNNCKPDGNRPVEDKAIQANLPSELILTLQSKCAKLAKDRETFQELAKKSYNQLAEARAVIDSLKVEDTTPSKLDFHVAD